LNIEVGKLIVSLETYISCIRTCYPDLKIGKARFHNADGQFNVILVVNESIIFRFPRCAEVAAALATQVKILEEIQPYLSLPTPNLVFQNFDNDCCDHVFSGYWMLPGKSLCLETLAAIEDETTLDRLAEQLAGFLHELHCIPVAELGFTLPVQDGRTDWIKMYEDFQTYLFPHMRLDAQEWVTSNFDKYLKDPRQFNYTPTFRHGDFGPSNILYDSEAETISGIIDFDSIGVGDPAMDVGAILNFGEDFFSRMCRNYPEMILLRKRTEFYRSTYALQEALYGAQCNVPESFEAGIAQFR
jgi:aminoglycoside 2''-phosphotransferase